MQRHEDGGDWTSSLSPADLVLSPAACYPVYPIVASRGVLPDEGGLFDVACDCFRREPSKQLDRLQSFRMREYVRIGRPEQIVEFRARWIELGQQLAERLALPCRVVPANDPFFGREGRMMAVSQIQQALKFEIVVPIHSAEKPTACMSFNYHRDHFGTIWNIRDGADQPAHTGCAAFGMDRLTVAMFATHGLDPADLAGPRARPVELVGPEMPLDPHIRRLMGMLSLSPAAGDIGLARRREAFRGLMRLADTGARIGGTERLAVPGPFAPVPVLVYTPAGSPDAVSPGLIFLHGGGFMCGDLETHDPLCRTLCDDTGCRVFAIDYRLAPEHPFPAAVDDAEAAALWVLGHADELRLDPARIAIAGDSAGATLAAAVCQRVTRTRPGAFALQLLLCPILDWTGGAARDYAEAHLLDAATIALERTAYLPGGQDCEHPDVSPLRAESLDGQPPAHIHTAEFDPVREDGHRYAARLRLAGVPVRHTSHDGMVHLFYGLGRVVPAARAALGRIGADVRAALA